MTAGHRGYVLSRPIPTNIETSVTGPAIIISTVAAGGAIAIEWLLRRLFRTGAHTRGWFAGRNAVALASSIEQVLLKLAEGDYQQVEKLMSKKMPTMPNNRW